MVRSSTLVLTYGGGEPVQSTPTARSACQATACPIYNALDPDTHHPVPPIRASSADLGLSRQPAARSRGAGSTSSSFDAARALPERTASRSAAAAGAIQAETAGQRARSSATCRPPTTTPSTCTRARGAEHQPRQHGAQRLLARHPSLRGGRRRACLITDAWEGIDLLPRAGTSRSWSPATAPRWPSMLAALTPEAGSARSAAGARRRVLGEHTYRHRAAEADRALSAKRCGAERWRARHDGAARHRRPRPVALTSSWGNGHATTYRGLLRGLDRLGPPGAVPGARRAVVREPARPAGAGLLRVRAL